MYTTDYMPTINISLPAQLKAQAEELVAAGEYVSFSDLVRDAVRKLLYRDNTYLDKLVREAEEDRKAGRSIVMRTNEDIDAFLEEMMKP